MKTTTKAEELNRHLEQGKAVRIQIGLEVQWIGLEGDGRHFYMFGKDLYVSSAPWARRLSFGEEMCASIQIWGPVEE